VNWKTVVIGRAMAAVLGCVVAAHGETPLAVKNLRCEYKVDPVGTLIGSPQPIRSRRVCLCGSSLFIEARIGSKNRCET